MAIPTIPESIYQKMLANGPLPEKDSQFKLEEALPMFLPLARKAFQNHRSLMYMTTPEDLAQDCILHVIEKKYLQRYRPVVTNKAYFLWVAISRKAVDLMRREGRRHVVAPMVSEKVAQEECDISLYDLVPTKESPLADIIFDECLGKLDKVGPFERTYEHEVFGEIKFSEYWVKYLFEYGYAKRELAKFFEVTPATIINYLHRAQERLQEQYQVA